VHAGLGGPPRSLERDGVSCLAERAATRRTSVEDVQLEHVDLVVTLHGILDDGHGVLDSWRERSEITDRVPSY
jgi:hypothetical protein